MGPGAPFQIPASATTLSSTALAGSSHLLIVIPLFPPQGDLPPRGRNRLLPPLTLLSDDALVDFPLFLRAACYRGTERCDARIRRLVFAAVVVARSEGLVAHVAPCCTIAVSWRCAATQAILLGYVGVIPSMYGLPVIVERAIRNPVIGSFATKVAFPSNCTETQVSSAVVVRRRIIEPAFVE